MSRPKIKSALTSLLMLVGCVFVAFAGFAVYSMNTLNNNVAEVATEWLPGVSAAKEMNIALSAMRRDYLNHIMALDDASRREVEVTLDRDSKHFLEELAKHEILSRDGAEQELTKDIRDKFAALKELAGPMLVLSSDEKLNDAKIYQQTKVRPAASDLTNAIDQIVKIKTEGSQAAYETSRQVFQTTMTFALVAVVVGLAVIAGGIYFGLSGIAMPIEAITLSMKQSD